MRTLLFLSALLAPLAVPAAAGAQSPGWFGQGPSRGASARIWVEDERDWFRRGERLRVRFATARDAYVAVLHIDPSGTLEFLYPSDPWDDGYVPAGRAHSLPRAASFAGLGVGSRPGIGYLYIVASPEPLDYGYFGGGRGAGWDWSYAGRSVHGDPFWALEQVTRLLVGGWGGQYVTDVYSYYVEGRHRYPSYACGGRGYDGWGWGSYYSSCDRVDYFLRDHPGYYDTRRYRGDRRRVYGVYERQAPLHGFKESPRAAPPRAGAPAQRPPRVGAPAQQPAPRAGSARPRPRAEPEAPAPRRPTLERRRGGEPRAAPRKPSGGEAPRAAPRKPSGGESTSRARGARGYVAPKPSAPSQPRARPRPGGGGEQSAPPPEPRSAP